MNRKTKTKKPKSQSQINESWRKKAVEAAKEINKILSGYKCAYCGLGKPQRQVHSHHIFNEGMNKSMSADVDNLICLCASHHNGGMYMKSNDGFNFHHSPTEAVIWLEEHYAEKYQELKERHNNPVHGMGEYEWKIKLGELKLWLKELKSKDSEELF